MHRRSDADKGFICPKCGKASVLCADPYGHTIPLDMDYFERNKKIGNVFLILFLIVPPLLEVFFSRFLAAMMLILFGVISYIYHKDGLSDYERMRITGIGKRIQYAEDGSMKIALIITDNEESADSRCDAPEED